jgi:hypothetical protein
VPRHHRRFVSLLIVAVLPVTVAASAQAHGESVRAHGKARHDKARSSRHRRGARQVSSAQCPSSARNKRHRRRSRHQIQATCLAPARLGQKTSSRRVQVSDPAGPSPATSPATAIGSAPPRREVVATPPESGPPATEEPTTASIEPAPTPLEAQVDPAPTGPPAPTGGWHIAFADAFGAKLGYGPGEDDFWFLNKEEPANTYQSGLNSNELQVFNSSADETGPEGLQLLETYTPDAGGTGKNYVGGLVTTAAHASGQRPFSWKSGGASTWAFECVCKWPYNTGEADPGWWSDATVHGQENEIDFFEGFGWGKTWHEVKDWSAAMPTVVGINDHTVYGIEKAFGFDPTAAFHRYTTTLTPNGPKTVIAQYVDGRFRGGYEVEYPANRKTFTHLVLSYALREFSENFKSGTRAFDIRSVAVYQDAAHAGEETEGGGIAPGTTIK